MSVSLLTYLKSELTNVLVKLSSVIITFFEDKKDLEVVSVVVLVDEEAEVDDGLLLALLEPPLKEQSKSCKIVGAIAHVDAVVIAEAFVTFDVSQPVP